MSRSSGKVIKDKNVVGYFVYDGTVDVARPNIYKTAEEIHDNWNADGWSHKCECGEWEDVILYSLYGGGFHWDAKACLKCGVIHGDYLMQRIDYPPSCFGMADDEPDNSLIFYDGEPDYIEEIEVESEKS